MFNMQSIPILKCKREGGIVGWYPFIKYAYYGQDSEGVIMMLYMFL